MRSERIEKMNDLVRNTNAVIDLDRARLMTEFYSKPSMDNYILRRAHAFAYFLDNKRIFIDKDLEQLAGHLGPGWQYVEVYPDITSWLQTDLETMDTRQEDKLSFLPGEKDELRELVKQWKGHSFGDFSRAQESEKIKEMLAAGICTHGIADQSTMNHSPNYEELVKHGYRYYIDECKAKLAEFKVSDVYDMEQIIAWQAMIIVMEAIIRFAHRYADLAEKMAGECADLERKQELEVMAENLRVVPEFAPKTFLQANQLVWINHLCQMLEAAGGDHTLGRYDQYMYPFYKKEVDEGKDEQYFIDIINEFKLKICELWNVRSEQESKADPGNPLWMHIMLGGVLPNGKDGCNELTRVFLRGMKQLQTDEPCISFRWHPGIDEETFRLAIDVVKDGGSHPAFYNDNTAIVYLLGLGFTLKEARNWGICGCIEPHVLGKTDFQSNPGYFNPIKIFEIALHNGYDPITKKQVGPQTGDVRDFVNIRQVMEAYEKQHNYFLKHFVDMCNRTLAAHAFALPTITGSLFSDGCIQQGKLLQQKGSHHHYSAIGVSGIANVVDSLAAIEECVFKKHYLTMDELMDLLDTNFEGREDVRQMLLNKAPKFGNNIEDVDQYAEWLIHFIEDSFEQYKDAMGGAYTILVATQSYNVTLGKSLGATPDGRMANTPCADNVSPSPGMDTNGPTAVVNSLGWCDELVPQSGLLLNQRFDPAIVAGEKGIDIIESVFRAHFAQNGFHIQINVVNNEVLRAAQQDPQNYKHILVRVAGYSAYFVDLSKEIQDNIIERTIQRGL